MTALRTALAALVALHTGWPARAIADETHLSDEMELTSLERLDLLIAVERRYDVDISDADRDDIATFGDLLRCVAGKTGHPHHEPEDPSVLGAAF